MAQSSLSIACHEFALSDIAAIALCGCAWRPGAAGYGEANCKAREGAARTAGVRGDCRLSPWPRLPGADTCPSGRF